jgi:hypothetical protein
MIFTSESGCGVVKSHDHLGNAGSGPAPQGKREVSFAEWKACLTDDKCQVHPDDHKWGRGRRPVMNINFSNAENFVLWLSRKTKKTYRLPTEAEWEYAARGGDDDGVLVGRRSGNRQRQLPDLCANDQPQDISRRIIQAQPVRTLRRAR